MCDRSHLHHSDQVIKCRLNMAMANRMLCMLYVQRGPVYKNFNEQRTQTSPIASLTTFSFPVNFIHRLKFSESHGNDGRCFYSFTCSFNNPILLLLSITVDYQLLKTEYSNQFVFSSAASSYMDLLSCGILHGAHCTIAITSRRYGKLNHFFHYHVSANGH
jgi:hypothetical protein